MSNFETNNYLKDKLKNQNRVQKLATGPKTPEGETIQTDGPQHKRNMHSAMAQDFVVDEISAIVGIGQKNGRNKDV